MEPFITSVNATPVMQEQHAWVNISAVITDNMRVDAAWMQLTYLDGTTSNFSMYAADDNVYYYNSSYDVVGNYTFVIQAKDTSGNVASSSPHVFKVVDTKYTFSFKRGWNVFIIPVEHNYTAKTLGNAIDGCTIVARWDPVSQLFITFVMGITPDTHDFVIQEHTVCEVWVPCETTFSVGGEPLSMNIPTLRHGWNLAGWCNASPTTAGTFADAVDNCTIVAVWNTTAYQYECFLPGISPTENDFVITRATGVYFYVNLGVNRI